MSEISKERLENYASGSWYPDADYVKAMARELLALRERAEPVAWISESNLKALARGHRSVYVKNEPILTRPVALYTAPPAPVVADALEHLRSIVADPRALPRRKEWISGQQYSYVLLENVEAMVDEACCAAMLESPGKEG
ncbi:hypothetical protein SNQ22_000608 [Cronobacter universalis]|nr:hypothetical protein [Cronobacter universalis]